MEVPAYRVGVQALQGGREGPVKVDGHARAAPEAQLYNVKKWASRLTRLLWLRILSEHNKVTRYKA